MTRKTFFPIKVTEHVRISRVRSSDMKCVCCGENMRNVGVLIKLNDPTYNMYGWVHRNCLDQLPAITHNMRYGGSDGWAKVHARTLKLDISKDTFQHTLRKCESKCSFCDKQGLVIDYVGFLLHPDCIIPMIIAIEKSWDDNDGAITARII
jgi:hypothetical protein